MSRYFTPATLVSVAAVLLASSTPAAALARTPSISGNGWVALGLIVAFIGLIVMVVMGALHLERRDAFLGRRPNGSDDRWMPFPGQNDDDDGGHHHGGHGH